jgi:hypothetical protein
LVISTDGVLLHVTGTVEAIDTETVELIATGSVLAHVTETVEPHDTGTGDEFAITTVGVDETETLMGELFATLTLTAELLAM